VILIKIFKGKFVIVSIFILINLIMQSLSLIDSKISVVVVSTSLYYFYFLKEDINLKRVSNWLIILSFIVLYIVNILYVLN
jgi:hypothetical protein